MVINTPLKNLKFITGANVNRVKIVADQSAPDGTLPVPNLSSYHHTVPGVKLGGKLGLEYLADSHWAVRLVYSVIEAGTSSEGVRPGLPSYGKPDQGKYAITPSWLELGVKYSF